MSQQNNSDIHFSDYRQIILQIIRDELYLVNDYPPAIFPDLQEILWDCFLTLIKKDPAKKEEWLKEIAASENKEEAIRSLIIPLVAFKNLLDTLPQKVVMLYRILIKKFIYFQQTRNRLITDEWEDIFQEVITRLISGKIQRIQEKFDFEYSEDSDGIKKSTFSSYLMVTVRNIYMDIVRERQVRPLTAGDTHSIDEVLDTYRESEEDTRMLNRLVIEEEFRKFRALLALHYRSRGKLELCLKLKCRFPVTRNDISVCFPESNDEDIEILSRDYKNEKDKNVFDTVVHVFNRFEDRENKSDTLRKWVSVKTDEIIAHLNRTHSKDVYNSKNLLDFITLYYENIAQKDDLNPVMSAG